MDRYVESTTKATWSCVGALHLSAGSQRGRLWWPSFNSCPTAQAISQNSEMLELEWHGFQTTLSFPLLEMLITLFTQEVSSEPVLLPKGLSLILIISTDGPKCPSAWLTEEDVLPTHPLQNDLGSSLSSRHLHWIGRLEKSPFWKMRSRTCSGGMLTKLTRQGGTKGVLSAG